MSKTLLKIKQTIEIVADDNFDNVAEPEEKPACDILHHRKCSDISEACLGDYIEIDLGSYGTFTATVHQINDKNVMVIFDDCVAQMPMQKDETVFAADWAYTSLSKWLWGPFRSSFPSWLEKRCVEVNIPSVAQIFGSTADERLPLMRYMRYRIAEWNGGPTIYWLRDVASIVDLRTVSFACVGAYGYAGDYDASGSGGVRPEIWIAK